jgi:hypothetical protein
MRNGDLAHKSRTLVRCELRLDLSFFHSAFPSFSGLGSVAAFQRLQTPLRSTLPHGRGSSCPLLLIGAVALLKVSRT